MGKKRKSMSSREIRKAFLDFFEEHDHGVLPSSSVIPHGDRTLLFANAGMNQFKEVFTGRQKPAHPRVATVQKCIRAGGKHNDLDNVGYTARHLTFFEMLGNFSFGDYFKSGAIRFAWDLLTERFGLDASRLWATIYLDDDEADAIWRKEIGLPKKRVVRLGEKDNYWSMGDVGPCGPCSEILLDRGKKYACGPDCGIGRCECDRFFEIWNLVFMQFNQDGSGGKEPLAKPCIDTGMGLERIAMVLQGVDSIFETDILRGIIGRIEELTGVKYSSGADGTPHRVIADHVRCLVFAFADGAEPSNEGRGYVLRRILRRAARYGRKLTTSKEPLLCNVVGTVLESMDAFYPEIRQRQRYIEGVIRSEEERFGRTLDEGIERFNDVVAKLRKGRKKVVPGEDAFVLYDTFGFPVDLVEQMAEEIGMTVDVEGYDRAMARQKERSRATAIFSVHGGGDGQEDDLDLERLPETEFVGYDLARCEAELLAARRRDDRWTLFLSRSPFYAESGGQVGDTGRLVCGASTFEIVDTQKDRGRWIHIGTLVEGDPGAVRAGEAVEAAIDETRRASVERNHTATHLLHAALRSVLGDHVHQKGSLVDAPRLRFDVTHFSGVAPEERERVEAMVLDWIAGDTPIATFETDYDDAVKRGAMALFGEKYGDRVRVVQIGDFSMELCGGTHVDRTGEIGAFMISGEGSVSAGVRRLEALTEREAYRVHQRNARLIEDLAAQLKVPPADVPERVAKLQEELKKLRSGKGRPDRAAPDPASLGVTSSRVGDVDVHHVILEDAGMDGLLPVLDRLKRQSKRGVFVLLGRQNGKVSVVVGVASGLAKSGWDAREIFRAGQEPIGGRGGGKPDLVRGGGTRPEGAEAAVEAMVAAVRERAGVGS